MEMSPRERVLAAFAHVEPDRVPAWCGASPEFWEKAKKALDLDDEGLRIRLGDDFRVVRAREPETDPPLSPGAKLRTPFGVEHFGIGCGQPLSHPLAGAGMKEIEAFPWPDPGRMDVSGIREEAEAYGGRYAVLGGDWAPFWHDAIDLMGMEGLLLAMFDSPEVVDALLNRILGYYMEVSDRTFREAAEVIDIFFIGNDFGTQSGPMVGEGLFKRFLFPCLKKLSDLGHAYGLKVMLHCCGGFAPLIPAMIEAGIDGLHAVQPNCKGMDLRILKKEFGDRIVFNGAVDSQGVLIEGTPDSVRRETIKVLEIMMPGGGYIGGASHDAILEETPLENVLAMFDTIREAGRYS